jgi:hypothetical protein
MQTILWHINQLEFRKKSKHSKQIHKKEIGTLKIIKSPIKKVEMGNWKKNCIVFWMEN